MNDLPGTAVRLIEQLAVGRRIPGTNKHARVSRAWRAASHDGPGWDWELVRLVLDLRALEEEQLQAAIAWLTKHGDRVQHLAVTAHVQPAFPLLQQLWVAPMNCSNLTHLEVFGQQDEHSLVDLAPLLSQLPRLQHLKATMGLIEQGDDGPGVFSTHSLLRALPAEAVPVMEELCPQLQGLHLVIHGGSGWMDARLSQLLPCGLKQLQLEVWGLDPLLDPASLAHCTALQELTMHNMKLEDVDGLVNLSSLKAVRMVDVFVEDEALPPLKSKLVQYTTRWENNNWIHPGVPGQLTALTALTIQDAAHTSLYDYELTSLKSLRHLEVLGLREDQTCDLPALLKQLAGLPQLRHLRLSGKCPPEVVTGVGALQQLTGLYISGLSHLAEEEPEEQEEEQQDSPWPGLLQQLPRLQQLEVDQYLVTGCHQPWWGSLTALTQLVVVVPIRLPVEHIQAALAAGSVPASLKQLVVKAVLDSKEWEDAAPCQKAQASTLPGVTVATWQLVRSMDAFDLPAAVTPCPWLPGVWEVTESS